MRILLGSPLYLRGQSVMFCILICNWICATINMSGKCENFADVDCIHHRKYISLISLFKYVSAPTTTDRTRSLVYTRSSCSLLLFMLIQYVPADVLFYFIFSVAKGKRISNAGWYHVPTVVQASARTELRRCPQVDEMPKWQNWGCLNCEKVNQLRMNSQRKFACQPKYARLSTGIDQSIADRTNSRLTIHCPLSDVDFSTQTLLKQIISPYIIIKSKMNKKKFSMRC